MQRHMRQIILSRLHNYELLDSGDGQKLERFGSYVLSRPDPNAIWKKQLSDTHWKKADAAFHGEKHVERSRWNNTGVQEPWPFVFSHAGHPDITLLLKLTPFKHTGLFPEQIENWKWLGDCVASRKNTKMLNLFGYTGGATLYTASYGANVTHVDASKPTLIWARQNQEASGLSRAPIRWIVDDALTFAKREVRRGHTYDSIILDPPSFGRSPKGKVFTFEKDMPLLLQTIKHLLSPHPLCVLLNSYATGYSAESIKNLVADYITGSYEYGELNIQESHTNRLLPCGQFVRVTF